MDNIRSTLKALFQEAEPEEILRRHLGFSKKEEDLLDEESFKNSLESFNDGRTSDERDAIFSIVESSWGKGRDTHSYVDKQKSIFNVLLSFTSQVLEEDNEQPICKFEQLLRWREASLNLGEEIFTTSFLAEKDIFSRKKRASFSWKPVISTNNKMLKEVLKKGVTDLHAHLKGSSHHFELSWLSLMNGIEGRSADFANINSFKKTRTTYNSKHIERSLYFLVIKAAVIRILLFRCIEKDFTTEFDDEFGKIDVLKILKSENEGEIKMYCADIQRIISYLNYSFGKKYGDSYVDYAISPVMEGKECKDASYIGNTIFSGERRLMYSMFKKIYEEPKKSHHIRGFFYTYLLIKEKLRSELIQVNDKVGFGNFSSYQDRKEYFIPEDSIYESLLHNMCVNNSFLDSNLKCFEARIAPKKTTLELINALDKTDRFIVDKRFIFSIDNKRTLIGHDKIKRPNNLIGKDFTYTYHFIKEADKRIDLDANSWLSIHRNGLKLCQFVQECIATCTPRNNKVRNSVKEQAMAINDLRKLNAKEKHRVNGIDAANSEIGCRPEVFAHAFRYIKNYKYDSVLKYITDFSFTPMGLTYHAGEDFLDIADGLRAIDEVIRFLDYGCGDRIGHGLALGIDAKDFYTKKHKTIIISKQDLLDNIAWMRNAISKYDITVSQTLLYELESKYKSLFTEIYVDKSHFLLDMSIYFDAYCLRGDSPWLYWDPKSDKVEEGRFNPTNFWDRMGLNCNCDSLRARKNVEARKLYSRYHFDYKVKKNGQVYEEYKISRDYIELITNLQNKMMFELSKKQIVIETNPSSNQLIGSYKYYANHPILRFFNLGLTYDDAKLKECPQLSVSLNTDDQGVFATCIENEYALMATALIKEEDENGEKKYVDRMVYDWLDRIRVMGFEQKFESK